MHLVVLGGMGLRPGLTPLYQGGRNENFAPGDFLPSQSCQPQPAVGEMLPGCRGDQDTCSGDRAFGGVQGSVLGARSGETDSPDLFSGLIITHTQQSRHSFFPSGPPSWSTPGLFLLVHWLLSAPRQGSLQAKWPGAPGGRGRVLAQHPKTCRVGLRGKPAPSLTPPYPCNRTKAAGPVELRFCFRPSPCLPASGQCSRCAHLTSPSYQPAPRCSGNRSSSWFPAWTDRGAHTWPCLITSSFL